MSVNKGNFFKYFLSIKCIKYQIKNWPANNFPLKERIIGKKYGRLVNHYLLVHGNYDDEIF